MGLNNLDDELVDDLNLKKGKQNGKISKIYSKSKFVLIILLIGILIGTFFGYSYLPQLINENENNNLKNCLESRELLLKENYCLYAAIENPETITNNCEIN